MLRSVFAATSIYILVSMMGYGIRPEDATEWIDAIVRFLAAAYLVEWILWLRTGAK